MQKKPPSGRVEMHYRLVPHLCLEVKNQKKYLGIEVSQEDQGVSDSHNAPKPVFHYWEEKSSQHLAMKTRVGGSG